MMMAFTHAVFAVMATTVSLQTSHLATLLFAGLGSQLPDVDTSRSTVGRLLFPLSNWIESRFPHRSLTHSFVATLGVAILFLPLGWINWEYWHGLVQGYFFGWFSDCFTKSGVTAFFPSQARLVVPGNPNMRLSTNTPAEWIFLGICISILCVSLNINSSGGLLRAFNVWLGTPGGAVEIVNQELDDYELFAEVRGRFRASSQSVQATFQVIQAVNSSDLLVTDDRNLYQVGTSNNNQIISRRVVIKRGRPVKAQIKILSVQNQLILDEIPETARITGDLLVEDAFGLVNRPQVTTFNPVTLVFLGNNQAQIRFVAATPATVRRFVGDRLVQGQLIARYYLPLAKPAVGGGKS